MFQNQVRESLLGVAVRSGWRRWWCAEWKSPTHSLFTRTAVPQYVSTASGYWKDFSVKECSVKVGLDAFLTVFVSKYMLKLCKHQKHLPENHSVVNVEKKKNVHVKICMNTNYSCLQCVYCVLNIIFKKQKQLSILSLEGIYPYVKYNLKSHNSKQKN